MCRIRKLREHPSTMFSDHLNLNYHKLSVKNKQCFKEMSNRNVNIWQIAFNGSLQSCETKCQNNRFILKCFFKITFLMFRANWAHGQNFRDIAGFEADYGAKKCKILFTIVLSMYTETDA